MRKVEAIALRVGQAWAGLCLCVVVFAVQSCSHLEVVQNALDSLQASTTLARQQGSQLDIGALTCGMPLMTLDDGRVVDVPLFAEVQRRIVHWPIQAANINSPFGRRFHPISSRHKMHYGIDLNAPYGAPVNAALSGTVRWARRNGGHGLQVAVEHSDGGLITRYSHLSSALVRAGQKIEAGQMLGRVGSTGAATGPHLHLEVLRGGRHIDPLLVLGKSI